MLIRSPKKSPRYSSPGDSACLLTTILSLLLLIPLMATAAFAQVFTDLSTAEFLTPDCLGISGDGEVSVGKAPTAALSTGAVSWNGPNGIEVLDAAGFTLSSAGSASRDGDVIGGSGSGSGPGRPVIWTNGVGMELSSDSGAVEGISDDGTVAVGMLEGEAFRWTLATGFQALGFLGGDGFSGAQDVSGDGSVVVGFSSPSGAFVWDATNGIEPLADLPGVTTGRNSANAISANGLWIVGRADGANPIRDEAVRWDQNGNVLGLGYLPGGFFFSEARGVSNDGSVVVGLSSSDAPSGTSPFVWTEAEGMRRLGDVLTELGADLSGYTLRTVVGISDDGTRVCGRTAASTFPQTRAYLATLSGVPEPGFTTGVTCAALALAAMRPRRRSHPRTPGAPVRS